MRHWSGLLATKYQAEAILMHADRSWPTPRHNCSTVTHSEGYHYWREPARIDSVFPRFFMDFTITCFPIITLCHSHTLKVCHWLADKDVKSCLYFLNTREIYCGNFNKLFHMYGIKWDFNDRPYLKKRESEINLLCRLRSQELPSFTLKEWILLAVNAFASFKQLVSFILQHCYEVFT